MSGLDATYARMRDFAHAAYADERVRAEPRLADAARKLWIAVSVGAIRAALVEDVVRCADALRAATNVDGGVSASEACGAVENLLMAARLGGAA